MLLFFWSPGFLVCSQSTKNGYDGELSALDLALMSQRFGKQDSPDSEVGRHLDDSLTFAQEGQGNHFVKVSAVNGSKRIIGRDGHICIVKADGEISFTEGANAGHFPNTAPGRFLAALEEGPYRATREVESPVGDKVWLVERVFSVGRSNKVTASYRSVRD